MLEYPIFGIPALIFFLWPALVFFFSYKYARKNVSTGKNDLKPNWFLIGLFTAGAFALMFIINWATNL